MTTEYKRIRMDEPEGRRKLRDMLDKNKTRLSISRVPEETKKEFIEYAKEKYNDDWGFALKGIWDEHKDYVKFQDSWLNVGELKSKVSVMEKTISHLEGIISSLLEGEDTGDETGKEIRKTLDGKVIGREKKK